MSFAVALFVSLAAMPLAVSLGHRTGLVDRPEEDRSLTIHDAPVPVLGGPAAIFAIVVALAARGGLDVALLGGVAVATAVGLVDDTRPLPPWSRIVALGIAGAAVAASAAPDDVVLAVGLSVACANAVNLVDGQDGLAGGVSLTASIALAVSGMLAPGGPGGEIGLATGAALIGFLAWNRPPARLFLGNGGAYGIGLLLAAQAATLVPSSPRAFLAVLWSLGYLAFEVVATMVRRLSTNASVVAGDRFHSYDLLAARLRSRTMATAILCAVGAGCGAMAVVSLLVPTSVSVILGIAGVLTAGVLVRTVTRAAARAQQSPRNRPDHR